MKRYFLCGVIFLLFSNVWAASTLQNLPNRQNSFISYTDVGEGQPLVLIHAFPADQHLWRPQQEGLKKDFRVITVDLWGFGNSGRTDGQAITMTAYADEIKKLFEQLNIQKAIVGGESMGGYVALAFLEKYPTFIDGLVLSNTQSIPDTPEAKEKREALAVDILIHGTSTFIRSFMENALSSKASEQTKQFLHDILIRQTSTAMASALRGMALRSDTSPTLAQAEIPVLIITGEQDAVISPQQSKNMHNINKKSRLVVIPHAGHLSNLEEPEVWNLAIVNMFKK